MFTIISSLSSLIRQAFRTQAALQTEILALRNQLLVLQRSNRAHRPRLSIADRIVWVWLSRLWSGWQSALVIIQPETVIAWHRKTFQRHWRWIRYRNENEPNSGWRSR
jgi:hypothetical protein